MLRIAQNKHLHMAAPSISFHKYLSNITPVKTGDRTWPNRKCYFAWCHTPDFASQRRQYALWRSKCAKIKTQSFFVSAIYFSYFFDFPHYLNQVSEWEKLERKMRVARNFEIIARNFDFSAQLFFGAQLS
jgi:hypothetical protein